MVICLITLLVAWILHGVQYDIERITIDQLGLIVNGYLLPEHPNLGNNL